MTSPIGVACEHMRCTQAVEGADTDEQEGCLLDVDYIEESLRELFIPRSCLRMGSTIGRGLSLSVFTEIMLFSLF